MHANPREPEQVGVIGQSCQRLLSPCVAEGPLQSQGATVNASLDSVLGCVPKLLLCIGESSQHA